jgi:cell division protein FtsB
MSKGQPRRQHPSRRRAPAHKKGRARSGRRLRLSGFRPRLPILLALLVAGVVLATSMPVSALLTQRRELGAASAALAQTQATNGTLASQAKALTNSGTVSGLARTDYGLVPPGSKAYVILPPQGASPNVVATSGHVPLGGPPVVPGSERSRQLLGLGDTGSTSGSGGSHGTRGSESHAAAPTSFWSRVARTLEFWR